MVAGVRQLITVYFKCLCRRILLHTSRLKQDARSNSLYARRFHGKQSIPDAKNLIVTLNSLVWHKKQSREIVRRFISPRLRLAITVQPTDSVGNAGNNITLDNEAAA